MSVNKGLSEYAIQRYFLHYEIQLATTAQWWHIGNIERIKCVYIGLDYNWNMLQVLCTKSKCKCLSFIYGYIALVTWMLKQSKFLTIVESRFLKDVVKYIVSLLYRANHGLWGIHKHIRTRTHTHKHNYIHTHTHTHTQIKPLVGVTEDIHALVVEMS